jgi:benzodiazapine receptor
LAFVKKITLFCRFVIYLPLFSEGKDMDSILTPNPRTGPGSWLGLAFWLGLCFTAAWFGSRFQPDAWYERLLRPALSPPNWVFAPVWTILYVMMALAAWLIWQHYGFRSAAVPLGLFLLQLALNALWTYLFFGLKQPGLAFLEILALWSAVLATLVAFWLYLRPAGQLLLPYLLWISFAAYLNLQFWRLNP